MKRYRDKQRYRADFFKLSGAITFHLVYWIFHIKNKFDSHFDLFTLLVDLIYLFPFCQSHSILNIRDRKRPPVYFISMGENANRATYQSRQ